MWVRLLFLMTLAVASAVSAATSATDLPGHYYLRGREIGSQILLKPDNTFEAMIVYGGAQGAAKGRWKRDGQTLTLTSDAVEPPAEKLLFDLSRTRSLAELADDKTSTQAQDNYVLDLKYARSRPVPTIEPVAVQFEFNQGAAQQWLWNNAQGRQFYLPFSDARTLTRIGFPTGDAAQPLQWFAIKPSTRVLSLNWTVDRSNQHLSYDKPEEFDLVQSQHYLRNAPSELAQISQHYIVSMYYGVPAKPPAIKPVDIYWSFDDGSIQKQLWTDSNQQQLLMPLLPGKTLKKLGVKLRDSNKDMEWFEVAANTRALTLRWEEGLNAARSTDLSGVFNDLELQVKDDCLVVDLGNGMACYSK